MYQKNNINYGWTLIRNLRYSIMKHLLLTKILHEAFDGPGFKITDRDLKIQDENKKHSVHGPSKMRKINPDP